MTNTESFLEDQPPGKSGRLAGGREMHTTLQAIEIGEWVHELFLLAAFLYKTGTYEFPKTLLEICDTVRNVNLVAALSAMPALCYVLPTGLGWCASSTTR